MCQLLLKTTLFKCLMKASSAPSLTVYFVSCILFVVFTMLRMDNCVLLSKSVIIPAIFVYYFIENRYRINWAQVLIISLCYAGDVYILLDYKENFLASVISFLFAHLVILFYVLVDFRTVKFRKKDILPIFVIVVFLIYLLITILGLQFKNTLADFSIFIFYGITLAVLSCFSMANYISKGSYAFLNLVLMVTCFIVSDVFYVLNHFYLELPIFEIITISAQVLSYYFMVKYFILRKKSVL